MKNVRTLIVLFFSLLGSASSFALIYFADSHRASLGTAEQFLALIAAGVVAVCGGLASGWELARYRRREVVRLIETILRFKATSQARRRAAGQTEHRIRFTHAGGGEEKRPPPPPPSGRNAFAQ